MLASILVINPNTDCEMTRLIAGTAESTAAAGTVITAITAPFGSSAITSLADRTIAAHAVLTALARHWRDHDAVVIAAFSDPGLAAAEEISPIPVFGLGRSGIRAAGADERPFSVVTLGAQLEGAVRSQIAQYSSSRQLISVEFVDCSASELSRDQSAYAGEVARLANAAVVKGAKAVLLGGGPFSGLAPQVAPHVSVMVVDGIAAAVREAQSVERHTRQAQHTRGRSNHVGIDPDLARLLGREIAGD